MAYSRSKLDKYRVMRHSPTLRSHLPSTRPLNKDNLEAYLDRYRKVIVKPTSTSLGIGVMQVSRLSGNKYEIHYGSRKKTVYSISDVYHYIRSKARGRRYLVQRRIALAKVGGRPFDLRVMVQRGRSSSWKVTGKLAKVAGSGYIITNIHRSGGRVIPAKTAIHRSNIRGVRTGRILRTVDRVALRAAKTLYRSYRWIHSVGLDIGVDLKGKVWIIEGNFKPDITLFLKLKSKSMYRQIASYEKKAKR